MKLRWALYARGPDGNMSILGSDVFFGHGVRDSCEENFDG